MIDLVSIFNIVLAKHYGLEWEEQVNLQEASEAYRKLSAVKRSQFDVIVTKAVAACEELYRSFPETHRTQLDMDIRAEIEEDIYRKLEPMFWQFLS
ncbi:hypothetical protein M2277_006330 [Paenibacillus sp. LBL]|uniref:hypothetical protein n=1 Tax=Paenibacillus sp. LBL TaxID=2940563 RepID=UPI00247305CC|nr:hypothetical protein [Paenibacillus sp. LBL]MDH6675622.1 hypothetical protein [Paenibacillus sp. LBL]